MAKKDAIEVRAQVVETLPKSTFRVELENEHRIVANISGRLRMLFTRISPGDIVRVEVSPYDLTKGRITHRQKTEQK